MDKKYHKNMRVVSLLSLGYLITILIGTILLWLPFASKEGSTSFIDALFTSTSATCVTGLVPFDTYAHFTLFGQIVIIVLIQIGGLGFMTVITLFFMIFRKNIGLYNRTVMMQSAGSYNISSIPKLIRRIVIGTLIFETIGAFIIALSLWDEFGNKAIYLGIFHSISAFCNAGFDVFGTGSLSAYATNPTVLITIMALIIIGGLGFIVWSDIIDSRFKFSKFQVHTKIVLIGTVVLIFVPAFLFFIFEFTNIGRAANFGDGLKFTDKITNAIFMAVSPRTAGFYSVDLNKLSPSGKILTDILMFIGGNSGSTAGGVKVTTIAIVLATLNSAARQEEHIVIFNRTINPVVIKNAIALTISYLIIILFSVLLIGSYEEGVTVSEIIFEVISAIATVGLSLGLSANAMGVTKIILIILMYIGRLGALTLFSLFLKEKNNSIVEKPQGKVLVG